jgi:hypothetical protein
VSKHDSIHSNFLGPGHVQQQAAFNGVLPEREKKKKQMKRFQRFQRKNNYVE